MGVIKCERARSFQDAKKAFEYALSAKYKTVFLYDSKQERLAKITNEFFNLVKEHNTRIKRLDDQLLPTNGYHFNDIDGCLAVHCVEISLSTVGESKGCVALFTGYNSSVLVDTNTEKVSDAGIGVPSRKAMASIAMLGYLMSTR